MNQTPTQIKLNELLEGIADAKARGKLAKALTSDILPLLREQIIKEAGSQKLKERIDDNLQKIAKATKINEAVIKNILELAIQPGNEKLLAELVASRKAIEQQTETTEKVIELSLKSQKDATTDLIAVLVGMFKENIRFFGEMLRKTFNVVLPPEHYLTPQTVAILDPKTNKYIDLVELLGGLAKRSTGSGAGGGGFNGVLQGHGTIGTGIGTATAGTPLQLPSFSCSRVVLQANPDNAGDIVVGSSNVVATLASRVGITLFASQSQVFNITNVNQLWIDTTNTGDKFSYYYEK